MRKIFALMLLLLGFVISACNAKSTTSSTVMTTDQTTTSETTTLNTAADYLDYFLSDDEIEIYAYRGNATELIIPTTIDGYLVTAIESGAFKDTNLASITIPETITDIGRGAFENTPWLDQMTDQFPVFVINNILIDVKKAIGDVVIPDGVREIPDYAFAETSVTSVVLPSSVTYIGTGAFENSSLESIVIPASVTHISEQAFKDSALESITFEAESSLIHIGSMAFYNTPLTSIIIPDSVLTIFPLAFSHNPNLTIYAEASEKPAGWSIGWNPDDVIVVWGYTKT